jgi:predicted nucleic acid-binding protein
VILLDTNVLSELMRTRPAPTLISWLDAYPPEDIWTTSVSVFEVRFGLALMADGRRRRDLSAAFEALLITDLQGRVASVDTAAADAAAMLAADCRRLERSVDFRDTLIAGVAIARRAGVATRNTRHFQDIGVAVSDPWAA